MLMFDNVPTHNSYSSNSLAARCEQFCSSLVVSLPLRYSDTDSLETVTEKIKISVKREFQLLEIDAG
jgi:hypothetical protein